MSTETEAISLKGLRIAVLIPCYNEAAAIERVITGFRRVLPKAAVYVFDNGSSDETAAIAAASGAEVQYEPRRGKGYVVCRMFSEIDADIYLLSDGDATYDPASAPMMLRCLLGRRLDMVVAARVDDTPGAYRYGHRFGNRLLTAAVAAIFGKQFNDMLSGYRVFSRRFVKSFPALSAGFEIETQLKVHALEMQMPVAEVVTPYFERQAGSSSKLQTFKDGWQIAITIGYLVKEERPLAFFSSLSMLVMIAAVLLAWPLLVEYALTGLVPRFPTAILASGMMVLGFLFLVSGLILDSVAHGRRELKRLHYLAVGPILKGCDTDKVESPMKY